MTDATTNLMTYQNGLAEGKLIGSKCQQCGAVHLPQRAICPKCFGDQMETVEFSGKGNLAAFTIIRVPPTHMALAGYDARNPYCVGIVALVEGIKAAAQILDVDYDHPETIKIGTELQMETIMRGEEEKTAFLAFKPV